MDLLTTMWFSDQSPVELINPEFDLPPSEIRDQHPQIKDEHQTHDLSAHAVKSVQQFIDLLSPEVRRMLQDILVDGEDPFDYSKHANSFREKIRRRINSGWSQQQPLYGSDDIVFYIGEDSVQLFHNDNELFSGAPYDLLCFMINEAPRYLPWFLKFYEQNRKKFEQRLDMDARLHISRAIRRSSRFMDRMTKVAQLDSLEQDHLLLCFNNLELEEDSEIYYYGLDDRIRFLYPQAKKVEDIAMVPYGGVLLCSVVLGDDCGAYGNDLKLLEQLTLLNKFDGVDVYSLVFHEKLDYRFELIYKPRPHNMVYLGWMNEEAPTMTQNYIDAEQLIDAANEKRNNELIFGFTRSEIKKPAIDSKYRDKIVQTAFVDTIKLRKTPPVHNYNKDRNRIRRFNMRREEMRRKCADPAVPVGGTVLSKVHLIEGPLHRSDPGFYSVGYSFASLYKTAQNRGYSVYYDGCWKIRRKKRFFREKRAPES